MALLCALGLIWRIWTDPQTQRQADKSPVIPARVTRRRDAGNRGGSRLRINRITSGSRPRIGGSHRITSEDHRITSGSRPDHARITSGSTPDHVRITSGSRQDHVRITDHLRITSEGHRITSGSHPDHVQINSGSRPDRARIADRLRITSEDQRTTPDHVRGSDSLATASAREPSPSTSPATGSRATGQKPCNPDAGHPSARRRQPRRPACHGLGPRAKSLNQSCNRLSSNRTKAL